MKDKEMKIDKSILISPPQMGGRAEAWGQAPAGCSCVGLPRDVTRRATVQETLLVTAKVR